MGESPRLFYKEIGEGWGGLGFLGFVGGGVWGLAFASIYY